MIISFTYNKNKNGRTLVTISASRITHLFTAGEQYADTIMICVDKFYEDMLNYFLKWL